MRILLTFLCLTALAFGTQYTLAMAGNWSGDSTWGGSGHPGANDTALTGTSSYALTVDVTSACMDLDCTGYTGTLTLSAGLTCYGNWLTVAGMTFTQGTQTVTFAATASGKTITSGDKSFYNVTWNGSGGEWTLQDNFTQTRTIAFTLGTLNLNGKTYTDTYGQTVTLGSGFTLIIGTGTFQTTGSVRVVIPTGATVTISSGVAQVAAFTVSGTGTFTATGAAQLKIWGGFIVSDSAYFTAGTMTLIAYRSAISISSSNFNAGTSTLYQDYQTTGTISSTQPLYNYTIGFDAGRVATVTLNSDLTVLNNFTILYQAGFTHSFSAGIYTINVGGNWANGDSFDPGTGTVVFNNASKTTTVSGTRNFFNVLKCTTAGKTVKFTHGTTQTVGSFVCSGTVGNNVVLTNETGTSTWGISDATGVNSVNYTTISYSAAAGGASWQAYTANGNVNNGSNTGWLFYPSNAMLIGGD